MAGRANSGTVERGRDSVNSVGPDTQSPGLAMIKGRVKTKSTGDAASRLYKHGGLSLMEMLVPWIEIEPA